MQIKATIYLEKAYFVGSFERTDKGGYTVARHIFGGEPSDQDVYDFVLEHYHTLNFGPKKTFELTIKRVNPKRLQREVKKEMERVKKESKPSTLAQDYMREELERNKKAKKASKSALKQERAERHFEQKSAKRKEKRRGH
ncbi:MAG: hypothetical protein SP1CHLAM54_03380 [Chlamydiia bacterium]|nr:hypothetical protein [Chlamydiia bacterium]MCH9615254.1 hypothetical protein [Chlamydiia bacterium]MCH9628424.1 hypothetical protein [Chlamydiia bacterium]